MTSALLPRLQSIIRAEAEQQRFELRRQWSLPLPERVARGYAIEGLDVTSIRTNGTLLLSCQTNDSRFREGDFLVIHRGDPEALERVSGVLEYDDETELEVGITEGNVDFLKTTPSGWIVDEDMLDLSRFYLDALDQVADRLLGRETILPLLSGEKGPNIDYARYARSWEEAMTAGLNESQAEAVAQGYATDLVHLIQGPPGTGKTFVLAHLARQLVGDGQRVFVTALTHRAINNALEKIAQVDAGLPVCKIGRAERARDLTVPNYENFVSSGFGDLSGGYIVGATPFATQTERLANVEFDVVLYDEASQVTLPLAMMGMLVAQKYIFIGDQRQLPPVTTLKASELARTSIFGYLSGRGYETLLTTTYRMNDVLTAWPGRTFYENAIRSAPGVAERRLKLDGGSSRWDFALDPQRPLVFLDLRHHNTMVRSRTEAETVAELVQALIRARIPPREIGVVVPYRAQGRLIRNLLRDVLPTREMLHDLVVDTVERMQGQEREVVLVSLATSSPGFAEQLAEFFFQPERLNVAITRPRTKLILIGSRRVLEAEPDLLETKAWVDLFRDLVAQCTTFTVPFRFSSANPDGGASG
jgi:DNA replication ATP-dependent helicase Dna2